MFKPPLSFLPQNLHYTPYDSLEYRLFIAKAAENPVLLSILLICPRCWTVLPLHSANDLCNIAPGLLLLQNRHSAPQTHRLIPFTHLFGCGRPGESQSLAMAFLMNAFRHGKVRFSLQKPSFRNPGAVEVAIPTNFSL